MENLKSISFKDRDAIFARLEEVASRANLTKEEREQLDYEWKIYNDYYNTLDTAIEEGRMKEKLSIAKMMKSQGIEPQVIATCTKLPLEEINAM